MQTRTLSQKLDKNHGPKRILSLDGGGIRGAISLGYLKGIETTLRKRYGGDHEFRLSDYFDLIGGTSTGAIIAAGLSLGMSVSEIEEKYKSLGAKIFGRKRRIYNFLQTWKWLKGYTYDESQLKEELKNIFGNITLGDTSVFKTNLCIVAKRIDTYSTWMFNNNPKGSYFKHNKDILLRDAIRASTAAPAYFAPQKINVRKRKLGDETKLEDHYGVFIDGGVTMHNNPSFQLLLYATLSDYKLNWSYGTDNLLIVSVGTGSNKKIIPSKKIESKTLYFWAKEVPNTLMEDAQYFNQMLLQLLSDSPTATVINREVGNLKNDQLEGKKHISYLRYNVKIEKDELLALGYKELEIPECWLESMRKMDNGKNCDYLLELGAIAASKIDFEKHFVSKFDII